MIYLRVTGMRETQAALRTLQEGAARLGRTRILIGFSRVYAYGIEKGVDRSGRLRRKAGGAHMLEKGVDSIRKTLPEDIRSAIATGGSVYDAVYRNALRAENVTKENTPVRTGTLRRDAHTVSEGR